MIKIENDLGESIDNTLYRLYVEERTDVVKICSILGIKQPTLYKYLCIFNLHRPFTWTEDGRERKVAILRACMKGREIRWGDKISKALRGRKISNEHRQKGSRGLKEYYKTHDVWNKGKKLPPLTEAHKRKISKALKGKSLTTKLGVKLAQEVKEKLSKTHKGKHYSPKSEFKEGHIVPREWRAKLSNKLSKCSLTKEELQDLYWDKELSCPQIAQLFNVSKTTARNWMRKLEIPRRSASQITKRHWKNPEYARTVFHAIKKKPNRLEEHLLDLIVSKELPFEYCGDGKTFIGGRCPDFINYQKKKIIELFGTYWHSPLVNPQQVRWKSTAHATIKHYKKYGFETVVIWDCELKNESKVVEKIRNFIA